MNSTPRVPSGPDLRTLLWACGAIANAYVVPVEAILLHILALGSALAGNLVSSKPTGSVAIDARYSLIVRSEDTRLPEWLERELTELLGRQQAIIEPRLPRAYHKKPMRALRRQLRTLELLGGKDDQEAQFLHGFIETEKRRKSYRFLLPVSSNQSNVNWTGKHSANPPAILANGIADFRKLLRGKAKEGSLWRLLGSGGSDGASVVGWVECEDFSKLSKRIGPESVACLGWQIEVPASAALVDNVVHPGLAASHLLRRLEVIRFGRTRFTFEPGPDDAALLGQQVANLALRLQLLPEGLRTSAVPDCMLSWHLAALLSALCWDGRNAPDPPKVTQCSALAVVLAEYLVHQHLHQFRQTFLADHPGLLEGIDRRMARLLPGHPCGHRDMQRRFRSLSKDQCLASLNRLLALGLAEECAPGRFRRMPPSQPGLRLSDFLSEYGHNSETAHDSTAARTDSTDK